MTNKKMWMLGVIFIFAFMGIVAIKQALPEAKEERIYNAIMVYSPYVFEKRIGGLTIINKVTGEKEKPSNADVMHRFDELNELWGKKHFAVQGNTLLISNDNNASLQKVLITTNKERLFIKSFYGI